MPAKKDDEQNVSPNAEAAAKEMGVDTSKITGTGFGGRVTLADVQKAAQQDSGA